MPGWNDLPQLPTQRLFGTDPNSPEYQTGYWGTEVLSWFITPELGAIRPGLGPRLGGKIPCLNSFAPGTQVLMADGTHKNIEDIKVGDEVWATEPETGEAGARKVTAVHRNTDTEMTDVAIRTADGESATLHTTTHHPFWDSERKMWVNAGDLRPAAELHTTYGQIAAVAGVRSFESMRVMHNLTMRFSLQA
ncbi:Hint domain-containing protein [Nonomuraea rhizosphaerae]|uniref:Hint domain-containing protein n=1 Tax=Nonomuraea rhizosphaerae TaxID=2665663 RepID=UPI001C5F7E9C|nr:Hint domain-containing protein [Nonomuraea rhizosphaerae]